MVTTIPSCLKIAAVLTVTLLLQSCSNLHPVPTTEYIDLDETQSEISDIDNRHKLMELIRKGRNVYKKKTAEIYKKFYTSSDVSYVGTVAGLLGGATSSMETVLAGSALAVGGTVIPERYALAVQGDNYKKITRAYSCALREVNQVPANKFDKNNETRTTIQSIVIILSELDYALFDRQLRVELAEPSIDALVNAVNESRKSAAEVEDNDLMRKLLPSDVDLANIHQALIDKVRVCGTKYIALEN